MNYVKRYIDNANKELVKASKRINTLISQKNRQLDFLDRSYEECWAYPDYEEKSEMYSDKIFEVQKEIEQMDEIKDFLDRAIEINNEFKNIIE